MTASVPDRLLGAMARVNASLNPRLAYSLQWEYRVLTASPGPPVTIDCEFVDPEESGVLPAQLVGLVLWPGPSGFVAVPLPGTIVRIGFVNGDPSKPAVVGLDPNGTPSLVFGFATLIQLGDQSAQPLTPTAWSAALLTALTTFATAMAALTTPPLTPIGTAGDILETALGALGPIATTKVLAT